MRRNENKIVKLVKGKAAKISKVFRAVIEKSKGRKNKRNMIKIAKLSLAFIFILLVASGLIFQNKIRKSTADYFISKGNYYFNNGAYDRKKAERYFSWAVQLDPKADSAYYQLGRIYLVSGKLDLARREIDMALAINPENKRSFYIRGLIDGYDKKYDDAISDFQQFVAWSPTEWAGHNDLAWAYFLKKDFAKVKEASQDGLDKADDQNPWLLNGLGVAYVNLGEPQKAEEIFAKAKKISGDITPERWIKAYPGNDPSQAEQNLEKFKIGTENNFQLATNGFTQGGTVFSACGSSCTPDDSCKWGTCQGSTCSDICGNTYNGQNCCDSIDCSDAGSHCQGVYRSNCAGSCSGTVTPPDCSDAGSHCASAGVYSSNICGSCTGTKPSTYTPVCSYTDVGVCDQTNCNKTIAVKTAKCLGLTNNGCGPSPKILPLASCSSICKDQVATCPPCSWKEIAP